MKSRSTRLENRIERTVAKGSGKVNFGKAANFLLAFDQERGTVCELTALETQVHNSLPKPAREEKPASRGDGSNQ